MTHLTVSAFRFRQILSYKLNVLPNPYFHQYTDSSCFRNFERSFIPSALQNPRLYYKLYHFRTQAKRRCEMLAIRIETGKSRHRWAFTELKMYLPVLSWWKICLNRDRTATISLQRPQAESMNSLQLWDIYTLCCCQMLIHTFKYIIIATGIRKQYITKSKIKILLSSYFRIDGKKSKWHFRIISSYLHFIFPIFLN